MKKPHKHAELIKLWADGAEIECRNKNFQDSWSPLMEGCWDREFLEFRIKPEPKPDIVEEMSVYRNMNREFEAQRFNFERFDAGYIGDMRLTWDGETRKLKSAEVL